MFEKEALIAVKAIFGRQGDDPQTIIDVVYEVSNSFSSERIRMTCLKGLYKICSQYDLPPRPMLVELPNSPAGILARCGGFGDVFKRSMRNVIVAVKMLRAPVQPDRLVKTTCVNYCQPSFLCTCLARLPYPVQMFYKETIA
ncbi:hypothetical protein BDM02DRAFT_3120653 [Thelephora ganbajun]|uniref:Uncharacterized protein n=1 Tax=Thelephora ganbajun TaxID=370292 RepID=A0ACB6Z610_THEGA|nr:hypothetical protein BDM02DRAFT_3120653 [Thelephora ganbajun]